MKKTLRKIQKGVRVWSKCRHHPVEKVTPSGIKGVTFPKVGHPHAICIKITDVSEKSNNTLYYKTASQIIAIINKIISFFKEFIRYCIFFNFANEDSLPKYPYTPAVVQNAPFYTVLIIILTICSIGLRNTLRRKASEENFECLLHYAGKRFRFTSD